MPQQQYVTYTRVSTKGQGESGLGLEAQESLLSHYLNSDSVVKSFTETASAKSITDRPVLQEAIVYCLEHGYFLAIAKIDRLSRKTEHALSVYEQLNGMLFSCDIPSAAGAKMDKFTLTIFMAIADREREMIGIRTKQALAERYEGREIVIDDQGKEKIVNPVWDKANKNNVLLNPKKKHVVKEIQKASAKAKHEKALARDKDVYCLIEDYRTSGKTFADIATVLTNAGYKTARGAQHTSTSIKRIYDRGQTAQIGN